MSAENLGLMVELLAKLERVAEQIRHLNAELVVLNQRIVILKERSHG
ncbi:hypothetical protein [Burkholderia stagnalis]|nr:hypothetical protein [Burkholderia stagnalis]